ncbi:MAG TPA: thioesterase family protein [Marmoricola sp.]|nr:thioesterase family protein [Marmoricola sp.]HNI69770.1 thioesterase family protein [Marmoricola sp.]HNN47939.1 thioesterase family protein [Marmoricola sp.]HNO39240.1 thioesterase family protein [Marmoricola sp.]
MSFQSMMTEVSRAAGIQIDEGWGQGRATYGGLVAALGLARMEAAADLGEHRLRALSVNFVGPVKPGPAQVEARVLRHGSSVTHTCCDVLQDGNVQASMLASFGSARESGLNILQAPEMSLKPITECTEFPVIPGLTPDFFQHFQLFQSSGEMPFSGGSPDFSGWMRFREPISNFSDLHLVALIDAWPPSVMPAMTAPAPGSTLTWSIGLTPVERPADPESLWGYQVRTQQAAEGYAFSTAHIWTESGHLAAVSQQSMAVFS